MTGRAADLGCNGLRREAAATGTAEDLGGDRERLRRGVTATGKAADLGGNGLRREAAATGRAADLGGDGEWRLQ